MAKDAYDYSYDLRVQADYGRTAKNLPLNYENLEATLKKVREIVKKAEKSINKDENDK